MDGSSGDQDYDSLPSWRREGSRIVLILVGLVASGKSTFSTALEQHIPKFRRCNQDDLGSRRNVENKARLALSQGLSVCIDRTNIDETQRAHWINIAREIPGTEVWCLVFDTPFHTCSARLALRVGHPTISSPEQGNQILARFANDFRDPAPHEGIDRILRLKPSDHPSAVYTKADLEAILDRISTSAVSSNGPFVAPNQPSIQTFLSGSAQRPRGGRFGQYSNQRGYMRQGRGGGRADSHAQPFTSPRTNLDPVNNWRNRREMQPDVGHVAQATASSSEPSSQMAIPVPKYENGTAEAPFTID